MSGHDDFAFEAAPGCPRRPGRDILWQADPDPWTLALRDAFKIHWIAGYLALIVLWKTGATGFADRARRSEWRWRVACPTWRWPWRAYGIILALAWAQARSHRLYPHQPPAC